MGAWPGWGNWREWRKNTATGYTTAQTLNGGTGTGLGLVTLRKHGTGQKERTQLNRHGKHVGGFATHRQRQKMFVAKM